MREYQKSHRNTMACPHSLRSYLGGIERGEHNVAVVNLLKLARQLDTTPAELMRAAKL